MPERGDVIDIDFDPQSGREQAGRRPALVLSDAEYNALVGLCVCCPITSRVKGYPFEVEVRGAPGVVGVVQVDQVSSLDWQARKAARKSRVPNLVVDKVVAKINDLIGS
ncbi:MAG TPA: endoribonuclease MazF [Candidatus Eremiobacteraceae bacterium]|nr:endoribonuclease MazF [Candidatus Eremiobacteraceae bacterium]